LNGKCNYYYKDDVKDGCAGGVCKYGICGGVGGCDYGPCAGGVCEYGPCEANNCAYRTAA